MPSSLTVLTLLADTVCLGSQPPEIREMAKRIVPKVRIAGDAEFFAAWNLDYPGLDEAKTAVDRGDYERAKVALKAYFIERRKPRWRANHWEMPTKPQGKASEHSHYQKAEEACAHRFHDWQFGDRIAWNCYPMKKPSTAGWSPCAKGWARWSAPAPPLWCAAAP